MRIHRLDWDSDFFGYEVGKLNLPNQTFFDYSKFLGEAKRYKLVYVFSEQQLGFAELKLVDEKVELYQKLTKSSENISIISLIESFKYSLRGYEQLKELALESGTFSRFYQDKNFKNKEYKRLYLQWIENLVVQQKAFEIVIYKETDEILGFSSLEMKESNIADIGLVAVSDKARGKGVGTQLIERSKQSALDRGFEEIQVVTQKRNLPALKLYEKCNFKIKAITNIYHYWNL